LEAVNTSGEMGAQDVEAVRRFYASWTNADLPGMLDVTDPAIDAVPVLGLLYERRNYRGHDGISQWFEEVKDLWEGFEVHVERTAEIDGAVVAFLHLVAHQGGRTSDARIGVICRMRDHKIVSITGRDADEIAEELPGGAIT
jgi:ketosteroid isomerase-like protein